MGNEGKSKWPKDLKNLTKRCCLFMTSFLKRSLKIIQLNFHTIKFSLEFLLLDFKSGWAESDYDDSLVVSEPRDFVRHRADLFGPVSSPSGLNGRGEGGHVLEEIEMKRQLWLKSCRGDENHKKTYGSAFVAPRCCSLTKYLLMLNWMVSQLPELCNVNFLGHSVVICSI